ncbi:MAG TPA: ATP-binding protein [Candidatus Binatia bacterium]|nr:ATP-binding protein [Candidatus Binatia bacterium]
MNAQTIRETEIAELQTAFQVFTSATATLEREYRALQEHARELRDQLEEKQRALMASLERQRELEVQALRHGRLAAMGEMAATLAHEVRNPLGAMELFTRMLLDEVRHLPEATRLGEQVARCIGDVNHLVTNLLEYARMPAPDLTVASVPSVIDEALALARPSIADGIRVERRIPSSGSWILDRALVTQALVNLLRNACEAMGEVGTLAVEVERDARELVISVADSGPGIPPEQADSIFDPFFTTKVRGTGLGLAVARAAVAAHGGALALAPSPSGARFVLRLPAATVMPRAAGPDVEEAWHGS